MLSLSRDSISITLIATIKSLGTACTLAGVGVYLHRFKLVTNEGKHSLALISQQVTVPLYLFTKILYCNQDGSEDGCPDVIKTVREVWILIIWPLYVVGCGIVVGWLVARFTKATSDQRRSIIAACAFGNSTGLPITLLSVLHTNFPASSDVGRADPTLYLSVYLLLYPALQWSIGSWLLAPANEIEQNENALAENNDDSVSLIQSFINNENTDIEQALGSPLRVKASKTSVSGLSVVERPVLRQLLDENISQLSTHGFALDRAGSQTSELGAKTFPQVHHSSPVKIKNTIENSLFDLTNTEVTQNYITAISQNSMPPASSKLQHPSLRAPKTREVLVNFYSACQSVKYACKQGCQPPVVGSILGIISAVTPIRGYFVDIQDHRSNAPFQWLFDGLYSVGRTSIPINMMVLGCNLSSSFQKNEIYTSSSKEGQFSFRTLVCIVVGKMLILPIIGFISVAFLKNFVLHVDNMIDGSLYLVMLIVFLCPTANNVMVMVELSGSGAKESIARVIGMQYLVAPLLLTITMTISIIAAGIWS